MSPLMEGEHAIETSSGTLQYFSVDLKSGHNQVTRKEFEEAVISLGLHADEGNYLDYVVISNVMHCYPANTETPTHLKFAEMLGASQESVKSIGRIGIDFNHHTAWLDEIDLKPKVPGNFYPNYSEVVINPAFGGIFTLV